MVETRRFVIEVTVVDDQEPDERMQAAEDLHAALAEAKLPPWVFSVDFVDPAGAAE